MGYGRWNDTDFQCYAATTNYRSAKTTVAEVFVNREGKRELLFENIGIRESRNSEANPQSTPIILGLDVTGSMGRYASQIAKDDLPEFITAIINKGLTTDPHILVMGIGDPRAYDQSPGQATQFETDLRIIEQTRDLYIEGRGGGNSMEGYDLAWYFANYCTATDAKTDGRKGFIFTFGDEPPASEPLTEAQWNKVFGNKEYPRFESMSDLVNLTSQNWAIFHVVIEQGSYCQHSLSEVVQKWQQTIGEARVLRVMDSRNIAKVCEMAIRIQNLGPDEALPRELETDTALRYAFAGLIGRNEF
jgi:hypothetical protein